MEIGTFLFWGTIAVIVVYTITIYNNLVSLKHGVNKAWSNIDVLLKQRHDELPKLVETCKQYMDYEQDTLEKVMQARNAVYTAGQSHDLAALGIAESQLRMGMGQLFAVAENYPDLKANDSFQHLQGRISDLANAIADRREFYNEAVNNNNVRIEQFPDVIVARVMHFKSASLLEFSEQETADVDMKKLFE